MNTSKLIVATAAAISIFGASSGAYAQSTSTETGQQQGNMPQTQGQMQQQTTPMNQGSASRPANGSSVNRADGTSTSGMENQNRTEARTTDGRSVTTERVARADRN